MTKNELMVRLYDKWDKARARYQKFADEGNEEMKTYAQGVLHGLVEALQYVRDNVQEVK